MSHSQALPEAKQPVTSRPGFLAGAYPRDIPALTAVTAACTASPPDTRMLDWNRKVPVTQLRPGVPAQRNATNCNVRAHPALAP
jgi:hypothetical protein